VADPYVIRLGGRFYMYFLGQDRARRQRLGVAVSEDGQTWWKLRSNPILELGERGSFDENGLGEPAVWASGGRYWMLYTGRDRHEYRRIGLAVSTDGVRWERLGPGAVLAGSRPWNSKVVCDPTVEVTGTAVRVWFGGGDVAHPAENIHGQIGLATLFLPGDTLAQ
jgi:sucrose-6-phosphate hydrolase SacC (GH32 family)